MKTKYIHWLFILVISLALAACNGGSEESSSKVSESETNTETQVLTKDEASTEAEGSSIETPSKTENFVDTPDKKEKTREEEEFDSVNQQLQETEEEARKTKEKLSATLNEQKIALQKEIQELKKEQSSLEEERTTKEKQALSLAQKNQDLSVAIQASQTAIHSLTDIRTQTHEQQETSRAEFEQEIDQLKKEKTELEAHRNDFIFTESFQSDEVWNKSGSGAKERVSFYHPTPPKNYVILGDHVQANHDPAKGKVLVARRNDNVKEAKGYTEIWNDRKSGANDDITVWRAQCPSGYSTLGDITVGKYGNPDIQVWCVKNNLLESIPLGSKVWDDKGSGAKEDFSAWRISATGLFFSHDSHNKPNATGFKIKHEYTQEGMGEKIAKKAEEIKNKENEKDGALTISSRILAETDDAIEAEEAVLKSKQEDQSQVTKQLKDLEEAIKSLKDQIVSQTRELAKKEQSLADIQKSLDAL